jgi:hypothetical protein
MTGGGFGGGPSFMDPGVVESAPRKLSSKMVDHGRRREVVGRIEEELAKDDDDGVDPEDLLRLANRLIAQVSTGLRVRVSIGLLISF